MRSLIFISLLLSSCVTYQVDDVAKTQTVFPPIPVLVEYSRQPIIEKKDNNFMVSDEFLENSILLKKYSDKITEWKAENNVK